MPWFAKFLMPLLSVSLQQDNRGAQHTHIQHAQPHTQPSQPAPTTLPGSGEGDSICANAQGSCWRAYGSRCCAAAAVSIAVATATMSLLPTLVDCCLCPLPLLLQPLSLPPTAVAVTVVVFVVVIIVVVLGIIVVVVIVHCCRRVCCHRVHRVCCPHRRVCRVCCRHHHRHLRCHQ